MGMSYAMLSRLSSLRKAGRLGPLGAYRELRDGLDPAAEVAMARQVKLFYFYYAQFRHLMTSMPPSMHATAYDPDDNRHDLRPFLLNCRWTRQFRAMDAELAARGLDAALPQTQWADGPMQVRVTPALPATRTPPHTCPSARATASLRRPRDRRRCHAR